MAKTKASKGKKKIYNPDANADVNANADAEMPMLRFPNGPYFLYDICVIQNRFSKKSN